MKWLLLFALLLAVSQTFCAEDSTCDGICGRRPMAISHNLLRVVGGKDAMPGMWPWQVSFQVLTEKGPMNACGGSLISPRWVLSAAHCFQIKEHIEYTFVVAGSTRIKNPGPDAQKRLIKRVIDHEMYKNNLNLTDGGVTNDISLVELMEPINCSSYVQPACLPDKNVMVSMLTNCFISGWGIMDVEKQKVPDILQEGSVNLISKDVCSSIGWWHKRILKENLCAGIGKGGTGICQGDSGGPLMCREARSERYWVVGISSWAPLQCGIPQKPGVFTSTQYYLDWIQRTMTEKLSTPSRLPLLAQTHTTPRPVQTPWPSTQGFEHLYPPTMYNPPFTPGHLPRPTPPLTTRPTHRPMRPFTTRPTQRPPHLSTTRPTHWPMYPSTTWPPHWTPYLSTTRPTHWPMYPSTTWPPHWTPHFSTTRPTYWPMYPSTTRRPYWTPHLSTTRPTHWPMYPSTTWPPHWTPHFSTNRPTYWPMHPLTTRPTHRPIHPPLPPMSRPTGRPRPPFATRPTSYSMARPKPPLPSFPPPLPPPHMSNPTRRPSYSPQPWPRPRPSHMPGSRPTVWTSVWFPPPGTRPWGLAHSAWTARPGIWGLTRSHVTARPRTRHPRKRRPSWHGQGKRPGQNVPAPPPGYWIPTATRSNLQGSYMLHPPGQQGQVL